MELVDPPNPNFAKLRHKCYRSSGDRPEEAKTETVRSKFLSQVSSEFLSQKKAKTELTRSKCLFQRKEKSTPPRKSFIQEKMREIRRQRFVELSNLVREKNSK